MTTIKAFIKTRPVLTYYVLTFVISWGGFLAVVGPHGTLHTTEQFEQLLPGAVLAMIVGPSIAGILLTGLIDGRRGLRALLSRVLRWRVGVRWYAVALLTAPLLMAGILLVLSLRSPEFIPRIVTADDKAARLLVGLAIAVGAGVFEEIGWTGFATPKLRLHFGLLPTGLIVGVLWAVWHWIIAVWTSGMLSGTLPIASYFLDPLLFLLVFRVLMVWVYERTGSLLVAVLMHVSLTASATLLSPAGIAGAPLLTFDVVWAAVFWAIVTTVFVFHDRRQPRQPLWTRVA